MLEELYEKVDGSTNTNLFEDENFTNHLDDHSYIYNASNLTEYSEHVVEYIAGFIVFKLNNILKCQDCLSVLPGNFKKKLMNWL